MMTPRSVTVASSPGREKLPGPPGLARLLLRKTRSRSVARASPMFGVRSRSVGPTGRSNGTQTEEPSSPKVTCIGQVRIRGGSKGKKKKKKKKKKRGKSKQGKCQCLNSALFCGGGFERKKKKKKKCDKVVGSLWSCWGIRGCCSCSCSCSMKSDHDNKTNEGDRAVTPATMARNSNFSEEPGRFSNFNEEPGRFSNFNNEEPGRFSNFSDEPARTSNYGRRSFMGRDEISDLEEDDQEEDTKKVNADDKELVSSATTTPPKNALFLMRCRSAPQHHNRFAPSPNVTIEETKEENTKTLIPEESEKEKVNIEKKEETEKEEAAEEEEDEEEEEEELRCSSARPLVLTRCKSEPASNGEKIMGPVGTETTSTSCFWAHTGSGSRQKKMVISNGLEQRTPAPLVTH